MVRLGTGRVDKAFAIAQDEKRRQREYIGSMGRDKTIFAATRCTKHTNAFQGIAWARTAHKVFDEYRSAVGDEET